MSQCVCVRARVCTCARVYVCVCVYLCVCVLTNSIGHRLLGSVCISKGVDRAELIHCQSSMPSAKIEVSLFLL